MKSTLGAQLWMTAAFGATLISVVIVFAIMGTGEKGTVAALRVSVRLSFLLFWAAYAGRALAVLFGPMFDCLARHGRNFGLAFAAALSVHLGLVGWFYHVSARPFHLNHLISAELIGVAWIYVLAGFSTKRLRNAISLDLWRRMRTLGTEYIAIIFAFNFAVFPTTITYFPFLLLIVAGMILRLVVALRYRTRTNGMASP
jgi:hypothetical protein